MMNKETIVDANNEVVDDFRKCISEKIESLIEDTFDIYVGTMRVHPFLAASVVADELLNFYSAYMLIPTRGLTNEQRIEILTIRMEHLSKCLLRSQSNILKDEIEVDELKKIQLKCELTFVGE